MKSWIKLKDFKDANPPSKFYTQDYSDEFKRNYSRIAKAFLRDVAEELGLRESRITYNPAGPACPGECSLYGMKDSSGIMIQVSIDSVVDSLGILYRTITHMKDYTGGGNRWMSWSESDPVECFKKLIA